MSKRIDHILNAILTYAGQMVVGSPTLPIAMPDVSFTAPTNITGHALPYIEVAVFPNRPAWEGVSEGVIEQGLIQVGIVWPRLEGIIKAAEAAEAVKAYFAKNTVIPTASGEVRVNREPRVGAAIMDTIATTTPVTISYIA